MQGEGLSDIYKVKRFICNVTSNHDGEWPGHCVVNIPFLGPHMMACLKPKQLLLELCF